VLEFKASLAVFYYKETKDGKTGRGAVTFLLAPLRGLILSMEQDDLQSLESPFQRLTFCDL